MEVVLNQIDELNATLTVNVADSDIEERVEKTLKDYRRKANVPGFRPGNVPIGLIKKMYGQAVRVEELNKTVSNAINDYIVENKLNVIGDPLPNESQKQIDLENKEFSFVFDIALAPEFEVKLSKKDKLTKYVITVDDEMVNSEIERYKQRMGEVADIKKSTEKSILKVDMIELTENGEVKENGLELVDSSISVNVIKDEKIKKELIGIEADTIKDIDIKLAYPNETELSSLLGIAKEELENTSNLFRITVKLVREYQAGELNQKLFDAVYGENEVKSEEEFVARVKEDLIATHSRDTNYKLSLDAKDKVVKKTEVALPEAFLERWLKASNKELKEEELKNEFPRFLEHLKWTLIKTNIAKANELKVNNEDLLEVAKERIRAQVAQYGIMSIPEEFLEKHAKESLEDKELVNKLYEQALEEKVIDYIKEAVKVEEKEISLEDFYKLFT
ncbi:MAG TPA: trigger factor [Bacteroidales bacterium]|nr:trigger factor [Bacteroidales bacterium]